MQISPAELRRRAAAAREILSACVLCGHRCGANRAAGQMGRCQAGMTVKVASAVLHPGEEPCLSPGAGTIFFSLCNLDCVYCQNWQISRRGDGREMTSDELAATMQKLEEDGAANIELVSPTPWLAPILDALAAAAERGLRLPVVYNTGGFESLEALRLLDGVADVYLPDMRYSTGDSAGQYSGAPNYPEVNRAAVREMYRQAGDLVLNDRGRAIRGLLIRLLVLPNGLAGLRGTLAWMAENLSTSTWFSLMAQYTPTHRAKEYPELNRPITTAEYGQALEAAHEFGFLNFYAQEPQSRDRLLPDFTRDQPFSK